MISTSEVSRSIRGSIPQARLTVADASRSKGLLVGGISVVGQQIMAVTLGAVADSSTQLAIRVRYPELLAHKKEVRSQIEQSEAALHQLDDADAKVHTLPIGEKTPSLSQKIAATRSHLQYNLTSQLQDYETVNAEREAFLAQAKVLVRGIFRRRHEIAGLKLVSDRDYQTCQVHHQEGALIIEPWHHCFRTRVLRINPDGSCYISVILILHLVFARAYGLP